MTEKGSRTERKEEEGESARFKVGRIRIERRS